MLFKRSPRALLAFLAAIVAVPWSSAQTYTVLYSFTGGADGATPRGGVVVDFAGNVYGTTLGQNPYPNLQTTGTTAGSVFKISSGGEFTLLYNFGAGGANGTSPSGGLVQDSAGNLYGATSGGGASTNWNCFAGGRNLPLDGCGEIFKIDPTGNFSVFFSFSGKSDCWRGCWPLAPLTLDGAGNLYGTTYLGGSGTCDTFWLNRQEGFFNSNCGVVFRLETTGKRKETVLHRFGRAKVDGDFPNPGLILDANGNLYGTTFGGGINSNGGNGGAGTVFKLDTSGNETVLFYFQEFVNEINPNGGLLRDAAGNLYGTAQGAESGAFKLDPAENLTEFPQLGGTLTSGFIVDAAGNFYGTTIDGGKIAPNCGYFGNADCGRVFKLDPSGKETFLYEFSGFSDGASPYAGVVRDAAGNLYGTAAYGGTVNSNCPSGCGVVFKITP